MRSILSQFVKAILPTEKESQTVGTGVLAESEAYPPSMMEAQSAEVNEDPSWPPRSRIPLRMASGH